MPVEARANDMATSYDRAYVTTHSQARACQDFKRSPRGWIDTNWKLKRSRECTEKEKRGSRRWQQNFGVNQFTEGGKLSEFARRQYRSSKLMQRPRSPKETRTYFFNGINTNPAKLDVYSMPSHDRFMETCSSRQTGLEQATEVPQETGERCRLEVDPEEYRRFSSRRTHSAPSIGSSRRPGRRTLGDPENGWPVPNSCEQSAVATLRRNENIIPYYLKPQDFRGSVTMSRTTSNEFGRPLNRRASNEPERGPHGTVGPPRHKSQFKGRDNWEPVGNWMNSSGYF